MNRYPDKIHRIAAAEARGVKAKHHGGARWGDGDGWSATLREIVGPEDSLQPRETARPIVRERWLALARQRRGENLDALTLKDDFRAIEPVHFGVLGAHHDERRGAATEPAQRAGPT